MVSPKGLRRGQSAYAHSSSKMKRWLALHPDLTREELAGFMRLVWRCQKRLMQGELADPYEDDKTPHVAEVEERLASGGAYLKELVRRLGLDDRPGGDRPFSLSIMTPA